MFFLRAPHPTTVATPRPARPFFLSLQLKGRGGGHLAGHKLCRTLRLSGSGGRGGSGGGGGGRGARGAGGAWAGDFGHYLSHLLFVPCCHMRCNISVLVRRRILVDYQCLSEEEDTCGQSESYLSHVLAVTCVAILRN